MGEPLQGAAAGDFRYQPDFLDQPCARALFERLRERVAWRGESLRMFGRHVPVPRLVAWCGEPGLNYRYSGIDHRCEGWLAELLPLRDRLQREYGIAAALVLLNRYRDGQDGMGWHTDAEPGQGPWLASVSLGAARRFLLRPEGARRATALELAPGSLLLMRGSLPHALPKTVRPVGERINLTFRACVPGLPDG